MSVMDELSGPGSQFPQFETRQALLILDLQNDFLSLNSKVPVDLRSGFVHRIKELVPVFRESGDVIWIRSEFEKERLVNDPHGQGETVITNNELPEKMEADEGSSGARARPGNFMRTKRAMDLLRSVSARHGNVFDADEFIGGMGAEPEEENECFLSRSPSGEPPVCCMPNTPGSEFAEMIQPLIQPQKDSVLTKSYYSAFNSTPLLPSLRGNLVTELFICGLLSNISVYATAIDAARHGYSITIVEDCLGFRNKDRHDEAMRQMTELMGAEIITSRDLIDEIKSELRENFSKGKGTRVPVGSAMDKAEFEQLLEGLTLNPTSADTNTDNLPSAVTKETTVPTGASDDVKSRPKGRSAQRPHTASESPGVGSSKQEGIGFPPIEVDDEDSGSEGEQIENVRHFARADRERGTRITIPVEIRRRVDAEKEQAAKINGIERKPQEISGTEDPRKPGVEVPRLKSERNPTPTLNVLEAASAALVAVAADPTAVTSKPTSTLASLSPPKVETVMGTGVLTQTNTSAYAAETKKQTKATWGSGDAIGEGDSKIVIDFLPKTLKDIAFEKLKAEVQWKTMRHRGGDVPRLVAVEGEIGKDGSYPIYRHPADESPPLLPWSPTTLAIKKEVEKVLKHPINHVLIQHYRDGMDYISEHSDKTLDIVRGSHIVNVSLGAQRTMTLRTKKPMKSYPPSSSTGTSVDKEGEKLSGADTGGQVPPPPPSTATGASRSGSQSTIAEVAVTRDVQRIPMPHNSMFILGQDTNRRWLHAIRQDKRMASERSPEEKAFGGERISLTFRHIGTFLDKNSEFIWGQGAVSKTRAQAGKVVNGNTEEAEDMIRMFGRENHDSDFDWETEYGAGFNVLNIVTKLPQLWPGKGVEELRVRMGLAEQGIQWKVYEGGVRGKRSKFVDTDAEDSVVEGDLAILLYLDAFYSKEKPSRSTAARVLSRITSSEVLLTTVRRASDDRKAGEQLKKEIDTWEELLKDDSQFIAGPEFSMADCALWPVLKEVEDEGGWSAEKWPRLDAYRKRVGQRDAIKAVLVREDVWNQERDQT